MGNNYDFETKKILPKRDIAGALWTVFGRSGHVRVLTKPGAAKSSPTDLRFDGFPPSDYDALAEALSSMYGITLKKLAMSSAGNSWGNTDIGNKHLVFRQCRLEDADEEGEEFEPQDGEEMLSLDLGEVSQCVLPGNNRNEIEMQFLESDTVEAGTDQLVAIRFYVPPDADADPTDKDAPTSAEILQGRIMQIASVKNTSGSIIAEFDESKGTFLTPRGRYAIELYDSFLRMRGAKYDYKIKYDDISRLFLLPKQDDMHMAFVIALDKPIRQGQQVRGKVRERPPPHCQSLDLKRHLASPSLVFSMRGSTQFISLISLSLHRGTTCWSCSAPRSTLNSKLNSTMRRWRRSTTVISNST